MDRSGAAPRAAEWYRDSAVMQRLREEVNGEFEEDDPRRGPFSLEEIAEAALLAGWKGRWHGRKRSVDWLAVQLQYGRGRTAQALAWAFGIGDSTIGTHKEREGWISLMSEGDRRDLARQVWIAGVACIAPDDAGSREALTAASEWRLPQDRTPATWQRKDKGGAPMTMTLNEEIPHDAYYSEADPRRADRIEMRDSLDELLGRMERDVARGQTRPEEDVVPELAGDEGRVAEPEADREDLDAVGAAGADPA